MSEAQKRKAVEEDDENTPRGPLAKYLKTTDVGRKILKDGVAVITVTTPEEAAVLRREVLQSIHELNSKLDPTDPNKWKTTEMPQHTHGLTQNQGISRLYGPCLARTTAAPVYGRELFGTEDVMISFDALALSTPAMQDREYKTLMREHKKSGEAEPVADWLHTDQAKSKPCACYVQGAFALEDLGESEKKTQLIVPKEGESIQAFRDRFVARFPPVPVPKGKFDPERSEWIKHTPAEREWLIENGRVIAPTLKAGQMLLWDSGVPHASCPGPAPANGLDRKTRVSLFVCGRPCELICEADVAVRRSMLNNKLVTSGHRVTARGKRKYLECAFPVTGRTYGKELPKFDMSSAVTDMEGAFLRGEEDSLAYKMAVYCGGYGKDHLFQKGMGSFPAL